MSVSDQLVRHVDALDARNPDTPLLPDDAICLVRRMNLRAVGGLIEAGMRESGLPLGEVIRRSIAPNLDLIARVYPYIDGALRAVVRDLGTDT